MIRVKFVKSHPAFGYFAGDIGFVTPEDGEKLLKGNYIIPLPGEDAPAAAPAPAPAVPVNPLPEDLPARDKLFAAGYTKIEDVKLAGDNLLEIPGISNTVLKRITKYLDKFVFGE